MSSCIFISFKKINILIVFHPFSFSKCKKIIPNTQTHTGAYYVKCGARLESLCESKRRLACDASLTDLFSKERET